MNAQHTAGSWIRCAGHKDGAPFISLEVKDWQNAGYEIARFRGPDRLANATLCAAAPDLLAALVDLLDQADLGEVDEETQPLVDAARAAIEKATGTAQ